MQGKSRMDYIYINGEEQVLIEPQQISVRNDVIQQYRKCRKDKKMTQSELASRTGISQPNINRFESGKYNPSLEMMVRIAMALDMELDIRLKEKKAE
ncbi:MAG: helix-turn-helix transcriptional regulator [Lachnospiraceae bacterium]|jgi:predicted transcriptional regulator|nr:helix-turn-helix transcriptional regulator [Lachnospiraceae bacterium]MDE7353301.1 helix-turn-helix transcriptional regulator [Acetatifactor sp.]